MSIRKKPVVRGRLSVLDVPQFDAVKGRPGPLVMACQVW